MSSSKTYFPIPRGGATTTLNLCKWAEMGEALWAEFAMLRCDWLVGVTLFLIGQRSYDVII